MAITINAVIMVLTFRFTANIVIVILISNETGIKVLANFGCYFVVVVTPKESCLGSLNGPYKGLPHVQSDRHIKIRTEVGLNFLK